MRPIFTALLENKLLLSEPEQCYHLVFAIDDVQTFSYEPGQFISCIAEDSRGKQQTRAYSIASAPDANRFDLCVNRVAGGFFSNRLCDLQPGDRITFHGPHGLFTMVEPATDSLWLAVETGIAPMRAFAQSLFRNSRELSTAKEVRLLYGASRESAIYYRDEFEQLAAAHLGFHYAVSLSDGSESWAGVRGPVEDHVEHTVAAARNANAPAAAQASGLFDLHAYVCGLGEPVSAIRGRLKALGWQRKQIIAERYD